jgi:Tol biopolymer transport system component
MNRLSETQNIQIWRLDTISGGLKQISFGISDWTGDCTPDGKWILYVGSASGDPLQKLIKRPAEGGTPLELARGEITSLKISPDGKQIAYIKQVEQGTSRMRKFIVQELEGSGPSKELEAPPGSWYIGWTPDGKALTYLLLEGSAQNLYMQPLSGGNPVRLLHFEDEPSSIEAYAWSMDGKKIAITRARFSDTDVVMFTGFR